VDNTSEQRIISLCTGYGGIELGLELARVNVRTVAYVEVEAFAAANLVAKIEEGKMAPAPVWTDVKTFPAQSFSGKVHGITGGYPCQPFSNAGQRKGTEDPRHLWPYIEQHIRTIRPVWCFFENVSGHLSLGFEEVLKSLRDMGYSVEAGLFTAAEVGANHIRERLFILAYTDCLWELQPKGYVENQWRRISDVSQERVSADSVCVRHKRLQQLRKNCTENQRGQEGATRPIEQSFNDSFEWRTWPIKPFVRGKDDGGSTRAHRIRLLGNGCVPQQVAKAWITLNERIAR